ncbi:oxidation resistance protein 1 [Stemphylium lycopersici]|nr:oxidation resistance protein 1 [Stemphylium lycopersici]
MRKLERADGDEIVVDAPADATPTEQNTTSAEHGETAGSAEAATPVPAEGGDAEPKLSKNQLKKQRRHERWEAGREDRKLKRKEKVKEKKERRREEWAKMPADENGNRPRPPPSRAPRHSAGPGKQVLITVVFDCDFEELMFDNELKSLGLQITRCYSDNRKANFRAHLALSSFGGKMKERFDGILAKQYTSWKSFRFFEEDFVQVAEKAKEWMTGPDGGEVLGALKSSDSEKPEKSDGAEGEGEGEAEAEEGEIVYLSSESDEILTHLKPNSTYIIGGLVDKNRHKGICHKRAVSRGIKTAKLPIGEYLEMKSRQVLVTNHVLEIMLKWMEFGDWGKAFMAVMPERKGAKLKSRRGDLTLPIMSHSEGTPSSSSPFRPPSSHTSPPPKRATPNRSSSYFTYPVSYAMSGILRRLNTDSSPRPDAQAKSERSSNRNSAGNLQSQLQSTASSLSQSFASFVSSNTPDMNAVFQPPHRIASPFQPPPLTPLSLKGWRSGMREQGKLLSKALAEEIRLLLPPRLQLVDEWSLAYSLEQNGVSLGTLYQQSDEYRGKRGGFVLVVRDGGGGIFGAYLSDAPHPSTSFYGNGECFLWRAHILAGLPDLQMNLPPPPSEDTTNAVRMTTISSPKRREDKLALPHSGQATKSGASTPERIRFKAFPYSGVNDYMIFCEHSYLSVGGGDGHYGLWLDDNLENGVSDTCPTFGNEPLSDDGKKFEVMGVELWYIGV